MHDLRLIRENPAAFDAALAKRGVEPLADRLLAQDEARRALTTRLQEMQSRRNDASKAIGQAMAQGDKDKADMLKAEVAQIKDGMPALEAEQAAVSAALDAELAAIPNTPADEVPPGEDEAGNVELDRWGTPRQFDFTPIEHADLGPPLGMEFDTAAAMSGARFTFLRGGMARLHRALAQFMLDFHTAQRGYVECNPPVLVKDEALFGTGQLPKFAEDQFKTAVRYTKEEIAVLGQRVLDEFLKRDGAIKDTKSGETVAAKGMPVPASVKQSFADALEETINQEASSRRWLIPTAEVSLTNSVREQIIDDLSQPLRLTALTPCFRSEAGAAGRDTRGFIRQHQFEKVELVCVCRPEDAAAEHAHMVASAKAILEALELPYRTMFLCAGDMGFTAKKTFDLEVWLPGQGAYREISSISWCGDFQARRM
ncbi:MAG: serine--tRNA ligase, partial [Erythrobacter sp.]|nr:serine--tRNA ligase [Erythrobacter sp.]